MSENLFGLTVAADKGLDDLQCFQRTSVLQHNFLIPAIFA